LLDDGEFFLLQYIALCKLVVGQSNADVEMDRLVPRHVKAGIAANVEEAEKRVMENDLLNGEEIIRDRMKVDEIVISREDGAWKPKE